MKVKHLLFFFFFFLVLIFSVFYSIYSKITIPYNKVVYIKQGQTVNEIVKTLKNENLIKSYFLFKLLLKLTGNDKKIQYGEYSFQGETSKIDIVEKLISGNYYYRKLTIPECSSSKEILDIVNNNIFLIGNISKVPSEGTIFPDTYFFQRNDDKNIIISRMQKKMDKVVASIWRNDNDLLKSKEDLINLASLIEAEAMDNFEKYIISSVFYNRIKKGMKLQSDPTILYYKNLKSKIKTRKIFKKDLLSDNPWNTYTRKGLPLTAICSPGIKALDAAMNPRKTSFLYFVADGIGGHRFSDNYKEHLANIKLWKDKLRESNEIK